jgi:hypothetical protein
MIMRNKLRKQIFHGFSACLGILLLGSCGLNPQNADVDMNLTLPEAKLTIYEEGVRKLGMMSTIYGASALNIMSKNIADNTGTSVATSAEIPRDITEIVKSTLNGIGGNITFIPYDPEFLANSVNTGYSEFANKVIPDVIVSGGITEFDRGLVTKGDSAEIDAEIGDYGLSFEDQNKGSLAQVTLDFNLIDFKTLAGVPRIQAVNGIKLHKSVKEDSFAFTVKSVTLGAKGTIKKIQGRHAAVRLLVQLSMIQLVGRYQKLPYWRLIPGGQRDEIVIDRVLSDFYERSEAERIVAMQSLLYLYGYNLALNGRLDLVTQNALNEFAAKQGLNKAGVNQETFLALFENVPLDYTSKQRRRDMPAVSMMAFDQLPEPGHNPVSASSSAMVMRDKGELNIWPDKNNYRVGDEMIVSFTVNKPMYVRLVVINSQGEVSTLFPNPYQSDNFCRPGVVYRIPPKGSGFNLTIGGPGGIDKLRAVASPSPIAEEALQFTATGDFNSSVVNIFPVRASTNILIQ